MNHRLLLDLDEAARQDLRSAQSLTSEILTEGPMVSPSSISVSYSILASERYSCALLFRSFAGDCDPLEASTVVSACGCLRMRVERQKRGIATPPEKRSKEVSLSLWRLFLCLAGLCAGWTAKDTHSVVL